MLRTVGSWHRDHGSPDAAAECFINACAWDDLIALALRFGRTATAQLRQTSVIRWFEALPEGERWANPEIALLHAAVLEYAGNALAAEQVLTEVMDRFDLTIGERAVTLGLTAFLGQWHLPPERVRGRGGGRARRARRVRAGRRARHRRPHRARRPPDRDAGVHRPRPPAHG